MKSKRRKKRKLDYDIEKEMEFLNNLTLRQGIVKIFALFLIISLNWTALGQIGQTLSYFNDVENSSGNTYEAGTLDFSLTSNHVESFIGIEATSEIEFVSSLTKAPGSLDIQYEVFAEQLGGNNAFCSALLAEIEHNGIEEHDGTIISLALLPTPLLGTWEFEIDLPISAYNIPHGADCNIDLVFKGWRADTLNFEYSGFTDEERIELRLKSRMIVLNEFLPKPNGEAYGFDFGNDNSDMPQGEWVELYNNSSFDFDLSGWYIWDDSDYEPNKVYITGSNTYPATTTIGANRWLVVYMNKAVFNNDGDTVKLFDSSDNLVDYYTYTGHDYCEIEPTSGEENSDTAGGSGCGDVPDNKSYARLPDGTGGWVDPIPTPGGPNRLYGPAMGFVAAPPGPAPDPEPAPEPILETATPSIEPVVVVVEEEELLVEPILEIATPFVEPVIPIEPVEPQPEADPPLAEEPIEEPIAEEPDDPEPPLESSIEDQTGQAEPLKEPEPEPEPEAEPEPEPEPELNNDNIENE